uniref:BG1 n=1 Tax=Lyrurus tetrix TaxID=1233216 RepID=I6PDQ5_9GALL|nr:BG1 [Lyrurus tetrix]
MGCWCSKFSSCFPHRERAKFLKLNYCSLELSKGRSWAKVEAGQSTDAFRIGLLPPHFCPLLEDPPASRGSAPPPPRIRVVAPSIRVNAIVGQDVVLRCQLSPCKDAWSSDIRWIQHRSSGLVHHYQSGQDLEQMEEYKGRTELLKDGLSDGNLDLRIVAVRSSDSGSYICAVQDGDNHADAMVNLEVSERSHAKLDTLAESLERSHAKLDTLAEKQKGSDVKLDFLDVNQMRSHAKLETLAESLERSHEKLDTLAESLVRQDSSHP